jgi:hypothetical protein
MKRRIVSFTAFCEWVQSKTVVSEDDDEHGGTTVVFSDGARALFVSDFEFAEHEIQAVLPPLVEIEDPNGPPTHGEGA